MVKQGTLSDFILGKEKDLTQRLKLEEALILLTDLEEKNHQLRLSSGILRKTISLKEQELKEYLKKEFSEDMENYSFAVLSRIVKFGKVRNILTFYKGWMAGREFPPHTIAKLEYLPKSTNLLQPDQPCYPQ